MNELTTEILDNIKPFSGTPVEIAEQVIGSGQALQQSKTAYTTAIAVQQPRSITKVTNNVLEEARLAGSSFYWGWLVNDKKTGRKIPIEGPSIDLAMCLARNYGNCVVDVEGTETPTHFMLKGVFIDLETGFTVPRLYRQRKSQNIGSGYGADRAEDMIFQIAQSKAQRNAIIKAMPKWLIQKAIETAKAAESSQIENLAETRAKAVEYFGSNYGITQDRLEATIGRPADQWVKIDLAGLKGTITAIKEGRIQPDDAFPKIESEQSGTVRNSPEQSETVRNRPEQSGTVRNRPEPSETVRNSPEQSGTVRNRPEQSGTVRNRPEPSGHVDNLAGSPAGIPGSQPEKSPTEPPAGASSISKEPQIKTQWKNPNPIFNGKINVDPTDRNAKRGWGGLRRGTPAKGTGLAAHIAQNQAAFEKAWPTMPDKHKEELIDKYRRFYDMELPWISKNKQDEKIKDQAHQQPSLDEMNRYNQICTLRRGTPAWRYAQKQVTGDPDNMSPLENKNLIAVWLKHFDERDDTDPDTFERFNVIFNGQRHTPAWCYAQGEVMGDENSSFRPNESETERWLKLYDEYTANTQDIPIDLGNIPEGKF